MTAAARRVLGDCKAVLNMLEDEKDEQCWRVLWAGAMALVRAVGHVLRKVDGENSDVRPLVEAAWTRWKADRSANAIFWEFIEAERNNILKQYRFSALDSSVVGLGVVEIHRGPESDHGVAYETPFALEENLFRPIEEGFGMGEDARIIYQEALDWWETELARIEAGLDGGSPETRTST